jgi:3-deoxy-D-manno-octulosonic-acid transferase
MGWALSSYLVAAHLLHPVWKMLLKRRIARGKEDLERVQERFGHPSEPRPAGRLLWVHALGIGEASAMLAVIRALKADQPNLSILLTTNTRTGADGLRRMGLPDGVIHQYAPIDTPGPTQRFLDHWRPNAMLLAELDLWPLMLRRCHARQVLVVMANARLTDHRYANRKRMRSLMAGMLGLIDRKFVQDDLTKKRLIHLGAGPETVAVAGILKAAADPLPDRPDRDRVSAAIGGRPVWLAAAVEAAEIPAIMAAHKVAQAKIPDLLLIVAPRQITQSEAIAKQLAAAFDHRPARRSEGALPAQTDCVYLADTMGEMGLWYRLAPISFIGHSLSIDTASLTGKNPFEAVALGSAVLHGPCTSNFAESYATLTQTGGARQVDGAEQLAGQIVALCADTDARTRQCDAASRAREQARAALTMIAKAVQNALSQPARGDLAED